VAFEAFWRVMHESHREIREQEKDDERALKGAQAVAGAAYEGKADLAKEAQDKQVDASFSQSRAQIAMACASIASSDGGNQEGGSPEGGGESGGTPPPSSVAGAEQESGFFQTLLANSGILGALLGAGGEGGFQGLMNWLLQQITPLAAIQGAASAGWQADEAGQAQQIAVDVSAELPSSAEEDAAEALRTAEHAAEQLADQAEQQAARAAARAEQERAELRQLEQQLLRMQSNTVNLA
jgi:hypothetical protein